jgi:hypothetical protein
VCELGKAVIEVSWQSLSPSRPRSVEPASEKLVVRELQQEERPMPRQLIEPHKGDKRYVRRDASGHFSDKQVDVGRSLAADRRSKSKAVVKKGEGDRGDQKRR